MKLKPVVASLVMLGLMAPAFAKSSMASQQAVLDQNAVTSPVCTDGWFNRITIGGLGSIVGAYGNQAQVGTFGIYVPGGSTDGTFQDTGSGASDLYVNNFNLLVNAQLSSWSKATLNIAYKGAPKFYVSDSEASGFAGNANKRYIDHRVLADEAYVTIGNFAKNPFYLKFGKTYVPFGDYHDAYVPFPVMSPAQMLAQTNAVAAIAGFASDFGLYGSVFGFRGETLNIKTGAVYTGKVDNFGAKIGYYDHLDAFNVPNAHVNVAASYINNVWDSQYLSPNTFNSQYWYDRVIPGGTSDRASARANALSLHADFAYKAFTMYADWVGAMRNMVPDAVGYTESSRLWGANVNGAYAFKSWDRDSSLGAGFQWSGNGDFLVNGTGATGFAGYNNLASLFPKWRFVADYKISLFKNTDLDLIFAHSRSYEFNMTASPANYRECRSATSGLARLMVQF